MDRYGGYFNFEEVKIYSAFRRAKWPEDAFVVDNGNEMIYTRDGYTENNWKPTAKDRKAKDWEVVW